LSNQPIRRPAGESGRHHGGMSTHDDELLATTRRALLRRIAVAQAEGRAPSVVGAVVRDGRMVWSGARGEVDGRTPDTDVQYRIGSITKTFVAVLVMRLRDEGLLALTDPLGRHLAGVDGPAAEVTVGQLLAHTSGLAAETPGPWWERTPGELRPELADVLGGDPVRHPAGSRHHYSNAGYALLGALVAALRGVPWGDVLQAEVLEPLGMTRTTLSPTAPAAGGFAVHPWADVVQPEVVQETGLMAPAGQLWSTAADLAKWAAFLAGGHDRVLGSDTVAAMRESASPVDAADPDGGYGLGLQLTRGGGRMLAGHTGSMPGFLAALWVSATEGVGALVLANCTSGLPVGTTAVDLLTITADAEPALPTPWRPADSLAAGLLELVGPWYWGTTPFVLRVPASGEPHLGAVSGGTRSARFHVEHDDFWVGLDGYFAGERLRVVRRIDGSVSHLDLGSFVFTRQPYEPEAPVPGGFPGWR